MKQERNPSFAEDPRTTEELVQSALADPGSEAAWHAIRVLHVRGSQREFEAARRLCKSDNPVERELGVNILGQLGGRDVAFLEESLPLLFARLEDPVENVIAAAGVALGHRGDSRSIPQLVRLKDHVNPQVRFGVVLGIIGHNDETAAKALIALSADADSDVRNWATYGLGDGLDLDTPQIRDALFARVFDDDPEIRGEALIGLANRRDGRVLEPLRGELAGEFHGEWCLEAAELMGDPALYPLIQDLYNRFDDSEKARFKDSFEAALAACKPREHE